MPQPINVPGADAPFQVLGKRLGDDIVYFGYSECTSSHVLQTLKALCLASWAIMMAMGFGISLLSARRTLSRVQCVTDLASRIGQHNLDARVPEGEHQDEIGALTRTFNGMLDRIENCVSQVHTMTDGLAHDLKGPITALRAKLELALSKENSQVSETVAYTVEELDRLSEFLNQYLDVAEARAGALRLCRKPVDLTALVEDMVELYKPCFDESGLSLNLVRSDAVVISADIRLVQRMLANLLDNELKHIPYGCHVTVSVSEHSRQGFVVVEDDGPGFPLEVQNKIFDRFAKGSLSAGRGLGLAFVHAVMQAHSGAVNASTGSRGARVELYFGSEQNEVPGVDLKSHANGLQAVSL